MSVFCPNCGNEMKDGELFCPACGTPVPAAEPVMAPVAGAAEAFTPEQPVQQPVYEQPVYQQPADQAYQQPVDQTYQQPVYQQPVDQTYQQPVYQQGYYQQPVYGQPVYPEQTPKKRKKLGFGRRILAFFLCIFLFLLVLLSVVFYGIRESVNADNLKEALVGGSDINIAELEVGKFLGDEYEGDSVAEVILDKIPAEQRAMYPELNEENIAKILEEKEVGKLISSTLGDVVSFYTGESDKLEIDADRIVDVLSDNSDLIEEYFGKAMTEDDFDEIRSSIEDLNENELKDLESLEDMDLGIPNTVIKIIKAVFSPVTWYIVLGVTAFFALMIILACGRFFDSSLMHIGITSALAGGLVFGGTKLGEDLFLDATEKPLGEKTAGMLQELIFGKFSSAGLLVLCIGGGLVVCGIIYKIVRAIVAK
ncbi:MAG: zinc-ribbon domain-containing protein [Lachnospiraceae bacterium]|nr:zinc-ribbon domain-containing protein [Lachnospiraceae bacterium]